MRCDKCGSQVGLATRRTHIDGKKLLRIIESRRKSMEYLKVQFFTCQELEGIINEMLQGVKY